MNAMTIALLGLRRLLRDRTGLFFVLIFPIVITLLVGFAIFRQIGSNIPVGLVRTEDGALSRELERSISEQESLDVRKYATRAELERDIRRDEIQAGVVIPGGYDATLESGGRASIAFIPSPRSSNSQAIRSVISGTVITQASRVRAAAFATRYTGTFDGNLAAAAEIDLKAQESSKVGTRLEIVGTESENEFSGFSYPSASNLVLFVFITSMTAAAQLVESRKLGISRRMLSTPTSSGQIVLGQLLSRFVIAMFQGLFIFGAGSILFDVDWGSLVGTAAVIISFALVSTGIAMIFGSILKTPEQAGLGVPLGIGLGMLGGCMWPLEIVGDTMRAIGHITPHAWAMDGFIALIGRRVGIDGIVLQIAVLIGFAAVLLSAAVSRFRKSLTA